MDEQQPRLTREWEIAGFLVKTPHVLTLSHPGINVVSAGELAGEMGPIEHYANAKAITGRAGLFPSRYQRGEVDHADGPLARFRNHLLRAVWLRVAANLVKCNAHYRGLAELWKLLPDLKQAIEQLPQESFPQEAEPRQRAYQRSRRRSGPVHMGEILLATLAHLGVLELESTKSEAQGPPRSCPTCEPDNVVPMG